MSTGQLAYRATAVTADVGSRTVSIVVCKSGDGFRDTLSPIYASPTTNAIKRRIQSNSGKVGDEFVIIFPLYAIRADIEMHSPCVIHHPYNSMPFFQSKIDVRHLSTYVHNVPSLHRVLRHDQYEQGVQDSNASRQQYTRIHRNSPFPSLT